MSGHTLHNHLFRYYEGATGEYLTDSGAVTQLQDFAKMLEHWSKAMNCALEGDEEGVKTAIEAAFAHADACEARKKVPKLKNPPKIVRYKDFLACVDRAQGDVEGSR